MPLADSVRGKISATTKWAELPSGLRVGGRKPVCVAYVKTGSKNLKKDFDHWCNRLGIVANLLQDWGNLAAYELICKVPQALDFLLNRPCVKEWHACLNVRVPFQATGSGEERVKSKPKNFVKKKPPTVSVVAENNGLMIGEGSYRVKMVPKEEYKPVHYRWLNDWHYRQATAHGMYQ